MDGFFDDLTIDFVIIGLNLLCFGWFCLILFGFALLFG